MDYGGLTCSKHCKGRVGVTRGAIEHSNAICQDHPGRLLFRMDGKGRYDAGARNEVRCPKLVMEVG